ncbi:MAG TPA: 3'-5' exonuclease, partial [Methylovirgula sp.]
MFHEMRSRFARLFGTNGGFEHVELKDSFRSVPAVLRMVDEVFASADHQRGLVSDDIWMGHAALKRDLPGLIEIWPATIPEQQDDPPDWRLPLDFLDESDPASRLAARIALKIADLIAPSSKEHVFDSISGGFRRATAGDILILVRSRGPFFDAVIRALKQKNIPVAGADRLALTDHIAVMDLIAAGRAALLPLDDLTVAAVLKSPLIGLDDDDLLAIAPRRARSLIEALAASPEPHHRAAHAKLMLWRGRAALTPFDFYARLLGEDGGRRAIEARLGTEACDVIDEFLRQALRAEKDGIFSLTHFLDDVEGAELEIKRDMETSGTCVRVMTVHAAKGLEAKIVFLPDTCGVPSPRHDPKIFCLRDSSGAQIPVWSQRMDTDPECVALARAQARAEAEDEHRRLLYVAMTRAEERIYIAGFYYAREPQLPAWNKMILATLGEGFEDIPAFWNAAETIKRRQTEGRFAMQDASTQSANAAPVRLPAFLDRPAPHEESPTPPLSPANALAAADTPYESRPASLNRAALERGRLMHQLLQYLPQVSPKARRKAAQLFLDARADHLKIVHRHLIEEAMGVLAHAGLDDLFGPQARAEVAVVGRVSLPNGARREVSGQVDRLVETASEVIVADFKTGSLPNDVPSNYLTQMALYRAVLGPIWPAKRLRMVLIFTAGPKVIELADRDLDAALALIP